MRKIKTFLLLSFLVTALTIVLAACGSKNKLPKTNYEKVKFAFNGVEKTFNGANLNTNTNMNNGFLLNSKNIGNALLAIDNVYVPSDSQGDVIDDIEYDEPPMIQFQCLKYVLEKTGKKYSFDEKYYEDVSGTMYFDINDGTKKSASNEYKYDYTFRLSLSISIDSNDLITANVSFDITLKQGDKTINTEWYVNMELDYDMKNKTPNYELSMYTANSEDELTYRLGNTYEYDYVEVKDNKINEWRKFVLESNEKLVIDSDHNTIESYISNPNFKYEADTVKWYKNNNLRKVVKMDDARKRVVANAFFSGIGLNSTDIDGSGFVNKNGTKSNVITELYSEMNKQFKGDVIYSIICASESHDDGGGTDSKVISELKLYNESKSSTFENRTLDQDPTLREALSSGTYWPNNEKPVVYAKWSDNKEEQITDLSTLNYKVKIGSEDAKTINLDDKVSTVLSQFGGASKTATTFDLIIGYPNSTVLANVAVRIGDVIKAILQNAGAKEELVEEGFPSVSGNVIVTKQGDKYVLSNFASDEEFYGYYNALETNGFKDINYGMCAKVDNGNLLFARFYNDSNLKIELEVKDDLETSWNATLVNSYIGNIITLPALQGQNILFEYSTDGEEKRVLIYGMTQSDINTYISSISIPNVYYIGVNHLLRIVDEDNDIYYELTIGSFFDGLFEIYLTYKTIDIMRIEYSLDGGTTKSTFSINYDYDDLYVYYSSNEVTLNNNNVVTFYSNNIDLAAVNLNYATTDFEADGTSIMVNNVGTNSKYVISFYDNGYDSDIETLYVGFMLSESGDKPKP